MTEESASTFPPLDAYGWDGDFAAAFSRYAAQGRTPGRIVRVDRGRCEVIVPDGPDVATVSADTEPVLTRDPVKAVCTGDWAALDAAPGADPVVRALLPRRTQFVRAASARSEGQVLAANIDLAAITVSLAAEFDLGRLERFLSLAWTSGAQPVVVLTKADLVADTTHLRADAERAAPGVRVHCVSALTGDGLDALGADLAGRTCALIGQSGMGKSTLVNALLGREAQAVSAVRDSDDKGRHTTTTRDLLLLPGGGVLIDTPGLRGVGLWEADAGLSQAFADIEELARYCRFQDCAHTAEPGCVVLGALEEGALSYRRYDSYRKLLQESAWIASRADARLRAELRGEWKDLTKAGREMYVRKRGGKHRKAF